MISDQAPFVSVIIPAYQSDRTIERSLQTLESQTYDDYEVIVVDSSPDRRTWELVTTRFPSVRLIHSDIRLLPYDARNRGFEVAQGELLVTTDPDIYAPADWLEKLVNAYHQYGDVIAGSLVCYGHRWIEMGMHLSKFDLLLSERKVRQVALAASANMLIARSTYRRAGPFVSDSMLSDTLLGWRLSELGIPIWLVPEAQVQHHHLGTWRSLLRERYRRGREFGALRRTHDHWDKRRLLIQVVLGLLPLRLVKLVLRTARNAWRAGEFLSFLGVLPIVVTAHWAWVWGETADYIRRLRQTTA